MKDRIFQALMDEGYTVKTANLVVGDLLRLALPLDTFLSEWIDNRSTQDYEVRGYSLSSLQQERKMTYPAALLTMDWLIKEPEKAIQSLTRPKK